MADYNSSHIGNDIDTTVDAVQAAVAADGIVNVKGLNTILENYLPLAGGTLAGNLCINSTNAEQVIELQKDGIKRNQLDAFTNQYILWSNTAESSNGLNWIKSYAVDRSTNQMTIFGDLRHDTRNIIIRPNDFPIVENCASYYTDTSTVTGTFKITLPLNNGDCVMQILEVYIYDYNSQAGSRLLISGYSYINKDWHNYACKVQGNYNKGCRMAFDGTNYCILLGTTSTSWNYPKLWLAKWIGGYSNRMSIVNKGLPTISLITSESGYTITGSAS